MKLHLAVAACLLSLTIAAAESKGIARPPDMMRQYQTVDTMRHLAEFIALYKTDHGHPPATLPALSTDYGVEARLLTDSWNRPFFYYASGTHFVLASFGRSGTPRQQSAAPGKVASHRNYESNIVMIDGEWAQLPSLE